MLGVEAAELPKVGSLEVVIALDSQESGLE